MDSKGLPLFWLLCTLACACVVDSVLVAFPSSFYVTIGTTIPFPSSAPVAQSGNIYVSNQTKQLRIDNFFLGSQFSFVADSRQQRGYVIENHVRGIVNEGDTENSYSTCRTFAMAGDVTNFGVPEEFLRDAEQHLVRGVQVTRYMGFDRDSTGPLQQVDYYIRNMSFHTVGTKEEEPHDIAFTIPWRIQTRRQQKVLKELTGAPASVPNWRYFGGPFFDEVAVPEEPFPTSLDRLVEDTTVTVDFYNFVPMTPEPSVFRVPSDCVEVDVTEAPSMNSKVDISLAHRFLVDLSFYSTAGRRFLEQKMPPL